MKNRWNDQEAARFTDALGLRVYTSRLLGQDEELVLHGGGNTSVKITQTNLLGEEEALLYVKGSGWDLASIDRAGFAPVRLDHLIKLSRLEVLPDPQMVNELKTHVTVASAPTPSVETILHALLPYKYVDHTHADAVVTVTNTPHGEDYIREIYGDTVVIVPYVMPGFDLARLCAQRFEAQHHDGTQGMVLMNHGIFSFADSARESYDRMIELVSRAEEFLQARRAWDLGTPRAAAPDASQRLPLARLRRDLSRTAGAPMILRNRCDPFVMDFVRREDIETVSQQGPATPDHVIRTKRLPLLGRDVEAYARAYRDYFEAHASRAKEPKTMLDPAPRVVLDAELGLCTAGRSAREALVVQELYEHTMRIIARAQRLEAYRALPAKDIFDVEYWDLEQAKLRRGGRPPVFSGEVALITGAASGIGRACAEAFLARGAAVVALDRNPAVAELHQRPDFIGLACELTDEAAVDGALEQAIRRFGGLDMLVLNAGIFPGGRRIEEMDMDEWRRTLGINLDASLYMMRAAHPLLELAPGGGRVVVIGSKNVAAPGPGAGAYSASKAALNQLMRIAALEWGEQGIRVNTLHPDAVFDTGLWTEEVLEARAAFYGMSVEDYKKRNIMKVEITSRDVAELAAEMCGPLFAKTTGAQLPVDGGDMRVI